MQSSSLCHYEILWETEHACPIDDQVSNNCTVATKDGLFDLSPLKRQPENYYKVRYQDPKSKRNYDYFLNICGGMKNFDCGKNSKLNWLLKFILCSDYDHLLWFLAQEKMFLYILWLCMFASW